MPLIPTPKDQWYVVHVLSGQENKVRNSFERRMESEEMSDVIFEVLLPTERVSEVKKGKRSESKRKFFPGICPDARHAVLTIPYICDKTSRSL